jgi:hypothetical protein
LLIGSGLFGMVAWRWRRSQPPKVNSERP